MLKVGTGCFVAKIFRGKDIGLLTRQFQKHFEEVFCAKPRCCRNSSIEAFLVAKKFKGVTLTTAELDNRDLLTTFNSLSNYSSIYFEDTEEDESEIVPFVACGTDEPFDPDMNYSLQNQEAQAEYKYFEPT